jgi:hypothetical protein
MWNPFSFIGRLHLWNHPPQQKPPGVDGVHYAINPDNHKYVNVVSEELFATLTPAEQTRAVFENYLIEHEDLPPNSFLATASSEAELRATTAKDLQPDIESIRDLGPFQLDASLHLFAIVRKPL